MKKKQSDILTIEQRRALLQVKIRENVKQHGCFIMGVFGGGPGWSYSIGIPTTFPGAAEITIFGLDHETMAYLINDIVRLMREGQTFEAGKQYDNLLKGLPVYFGLVDLAQYDDHFGQAQMYHQSSTGFPVLQLVWPDTKGRFPWQHGFEEKFRDAQKLLFTPLNQ